MRKRAMIDDGQYVRPLGHNLPAGNVRYGTVQYHPSLKLRASGFVQHERRRVTRATVHSRLQYEVL